VNDIEKRIKISTDLLDTLREMNDRNFRRTTRSLHLYQLALLTYPLDIGLAYSLLVSSVDSLSCKFSRGGSKDKFVHFIEQFLPKSFWDSFDSRAWQEDRWLDSITPWKHSILDSYRERYERDGEKALSSLERTLSEGAVRKLKSAFEEKLEIPPEEEQAYSHILQHWYLYRLDMKLAPSELSDMLELIYEEVRSPFFHGGRSPPRNAIDRYETARVKPKINEDGMVVWERDIPSFYTFERITHDSILNYLLS
jgi:hypothetical protein